VNGHPKNHGFGLPTVMAFGVLADVETGTPEVLSELTLTTAIRTAAMSAVAAGAGAAGRRSMALIGNGAQSEFQALAFHHLLGIEEIRLFDVDRSATAQARCATWRTPACGCASAPACARPCAAPTS
jgi:ornithine cyclodeaminase